MDCTEHAVRRALVKSERHPASPAPASSRVPIVEEGTVTAVDLLVLVPWIIFAVGVAAVVVLAFTRDCRAGQFLQRHWGRSRRR
jgi:hypothetical protein